MNICECWLCKSRDLSVRFYCFALRENALDFTDLEDKLPDDDNKSFFIVCEKCASKLQNITETE